LVKTKGSIRFNSKENIKEYGFEEGYSMSIEDFGEKDKEGFV